MFVSINTLLRINVALKSTRMGVAQLAYEPQLRTGACESFKTCLKTVKMPFTSSHPCKGCWITYMNANYSTQKI